MHPYYSVADEKPRQRDRVKKRFKLYGASCKHEVQLAVRTKDRLRVGRLHPGSALRAKAKASAGSERLIPPNPIAVVAVSRLIVIAHPFTLPIFILRSKSRVFGSGDGTSPSVSPKAAR